MVTVKIDIDERYPCYILTNDGYGLDVNMLESDYDRCIKADKEYDECQCILSDYYDRTKLDMLQQASDMKQAEQDWKNKQW